MGQLESLRPLAAGIFDGLADANIRESDAAMRRGHWDGSREIQSYRLWDCARLIREVEERESGESRVLELEDELDGLRSELEQEREGTADLKREVDKLKAKIKDQAAEIRALSA